MKRFFLILAALLSCAAPQNARAAIDSQARLSIGDALIYEGNSRYRELAFPVSLPAALPYDVSASYQTKPISAVAGEDYTPQMAGQIVLKAGQTSANIIVRVTGDAVEERDEKFLVQLSRPKRASLGDGDGIGTIRDDDYNGEVSISDTSLTEGNDGQKLARVQVSLSSAPLHQIEVRYEARDDSAISRQDYLPTRGSLFFKPGRRVLSIAVPILSDKTPESDERLFVSIVASPYNPVLNITKDLGVITLKNDDGAPVSTPIELSIISHTRSEEGGGLRPTLFTVMLAKPAPHPLEINFETQDRTATAPDDYIAKSGVLRFETGQERAEIIVFMASDDIEESDETYAVVLSAPEGLARITGITEAVGTILDDDYSGRVEVRGNSGDFDYDFTGREGNDIPQFASFQVSLSQTPLHPVLVNYATQDGTALSGSDYIAQNGSLIFSPSGDLAQTISVPIVNDALVEDDERFTLNFSIAGRSIPFPSLIRILNDDAPPSTGASRIAFSDDVDFDIPGREIFTVNSDGTGRVRLTFGGGNYPGLSADGSKIVYVVTSRVFKPEAPADGQFVSSSALWVMNSNGSDQKLLFQPQSEVSLSFPRFSPDGKTLAVVVANQFFSLGSLLLLNADGTGAHTLTHGVFTTPISFSPDGTKIAFTASPTSGAYQIGVVNTDGSGKTLLDTGGNFEVDPNFSPGGTKLVFSSFRNGRGDLYIADSDGSAAALLLSSGQQGSLSKPVFSPNGQQIAFEVADRIASINSNGSGLKILTFGFSPSWGTGSLAAIKAPASASSAAPVPSAGNS